jgi:hypothetical protein
MREEAQGLIVLVFPYPGSVGARQEKRQTDYQQLESATWSQTGNQSLVLNRIESGMNLCNKTPAERHDGD